MYVAGEALLTSCPSMSSTDHGGTCGEATYNEGKLTGDGGVEYLSTPVRESHVLDAGRSTRTPTA